MALCLERENIQHDSFRLLFPSYPPLTKGKNHSQAINAQSLRQMIRQLTADC